MIIVGITYEKATEGYFAAMVRNFRIPFLEVGMNRSWDELEVAVTRDGRTRMDGDLAVELRRRGFYIKQGV